jgi:hypothetical protein
MSGAPSTSPRRWWRWTSWAVASSVWVWAFGLFGMLVVGVSGLNADGPTLVARLVGSTAVGVAVAGPAVLLVLHRLARVGRRRVLGGSASVGALVALGVYVWTG